MKKPQNKDGNKTISGAEVKKKTHFEKMAF